MTLALPGAPFPVTYRELWLPRGINENASLPTSVEGGHGLAFTGARRGTTCDGVHGDGSNTSNINCGAIHNNAATYWLSFRFKLDQPFSAAAVTDQYLWGKFVDATHFLWLVLKAADGKLYFEGQDGGANDFSIAAQDGAADITSWNSGQWYQVLASISAVNNVRFRVDNGTVVTDASAIAFPNGGDFVLLDYDDPGAGTGFEGIEVGFFGGTDDLSQAAPDEEYDLYTGIPPADVVNEYLLDEGRGVTAYDRGSGGNNGTLDTAATWRFGQVESPVISFDAHNDHAKSSAGIDITGDVTVIWVGKIKSSYDGLAGSRELFIYWIDATNTIEIYYSVGPDDIRLTVVGGGTPASVSYNEKPEIDSYMIMMGIIKSGIEVCININGFQYGRVALAGIIGGGVATLDLGYNHFAPAFRDISKPLFVALIDGAFDQAQALAYSRYLQKVFNLPITI